VVLRKHETDNGAERHQRTHRKWEIEKRDWRGVEEVAPNLQVGTSST
jgi:hypothetical protein